MPAAPPLRELVREMEASGALADPAWRAAFLAVPRELFVPYYYAPLPGGGHERLWRYDPDPVRRERWRTGVYQDVPLATRVREGLLLSSSSQPSLMAAMLAALRVADGMNVLEIGTGPGYNAALLAHRLGDALVTTLDLDPDITEAARTHLAAAGHRPRVVTGDGARGWPQRAPYDRVIATCAVPSLPAAWLEQCGPGALVVAPLGTGLASVRVSGPGEATGRFLPTPAYFVPLRGGRGPAASGAGPGARAAEAAAEGSGGVPRWAAREDSFGFLRSLSAAALPPGEAVELWESAGRPARERYGVTVRGGQQWAWLDDPNGPAAWPLPVG